MQTPNRKKIWAEKLLEPTGIKINGSNPWDIKVNNEKVYDRVVSEGSLGLGESYMEGWWDCGSLDQFFTKLLQADTSRKLGLTWIDIAHLAKAKLFNLQIGRRAFEVAEKHYDLGNDFFAAMIGPSLMYSCGYWKNATTLEEAQFAKLDLICKKLNLQKGQRILEIGCGWGAFAKFAIENYGVSIVGLTVSKEQKKYAEELCKGLPAEFRLQDYHEVNEKFDHVVSIAMFEAVGVKNYRSYMEMARRCLKDGGLFLLHTIGGLEPSSAFDPWLNKYIFPNSHIPSLREICQSVENVFVIEDVHNFGGYYDRTLMEWHKNFKQRWPEFEKQYGAKFYRMWEYYLLQCAALFRARKTQLWHIVFSPHGVKEGYESIR